MIKLAILLSRKKIPYLIKIWAVLALFNVQVLSFQDEKIFLYASELPKPLLSFQKDLRKHVVDVILATQKYEVVFSKIPDILSKSIKKQKVLKYKIRTDGKYYNLEISLIDADSVAIEKVELYTKIKQKHLLYLFRLHLYEFILNRSLKENELENEIKRSLKVSSKISRKLIQKLQNKARQKELNKQEISDAFRISKITKNNRTLILRESRKETKERQKKKSLLSLLRDVDRDITWLKKKQIKTASLQKKENKKQKRSTSFNKVLNPFLSLGAISLKSDDELTQSLATDQVHFAWKYVKRDQKIEDIISLNNSFKSTLSFILESIFYNPIHHSKLFYRLGFEYDAALDTEPIDMEDHILVRAGLGYRVNYRFIPSFYFERSNLNYANLNNIGDGIESNSHVIYWVNSELAYLTPTNYFSIHLAKSVYGTKNGDIRERSSPSGIRVGANIRHYFSSRLIGLRFWTGLEHRYSKFKRKNKSISELQIKKTELTLYLGTFF